MQKKEIPDEVKQVEDDPKFPVKPVVQTLTLILTWLATQSWLDDPWQTLVVLAGGFLGGYLPRNPKRLKGSK